MFLLMILSYDSASIIAKRMAKYAQFRYHFYILISTIEEFTSQLLPFIYS